MRLATVFDSDSNEARPVFELPGGQRVELRELFHPAPSREDLELSEMPLYFTKLSKTVEFLDDVNDAVRQWARHRSDATASAREASRIDRMPFLPPVPNVRSFREFDAFEAHVRARRTRYGLPFPETWRKAPTFSFGATGSLIGHEAAVIAPLECDELDFGLQIAAIIGRGGRDIRAADAWKHVAGFTIVNSFIARDLERREIELSVGRGKSRDFATAVGPYLVSLTALRDRIDSNDRLHLTMRAMVNGREVARSDAAAMAFTWPELIEDASRDSQIFPGDLIAGGVAPTGSLIDGTSQPPSWLKPGDVVELEVERLGILRSPIAPRPSPGAAATDAARVAAQRIPHFRLCPSPRNRGEVG